MTKTIVAESRTTDGMRVLDVASGTGEPAISIATLLQGTGTVTATDLSPGPLKVGQQRARERNLTNIGFLAADVHQLPFATGQFDRVTCRLGVMFFADPSRALREIHRVLKPGGRATLLAWGPLQQPYFQTTVGTILSLLPALQVPPSGAGMAKFGQAGALGSALREAGFERVDEEFRDVPWNWPGAPEDLWEWFQEVTVPFHPLFRAIPADRRAAVDAAVLCALQNRYDGHEVKFDATIVLASATR